MTLLTRKQREILAHMREHADDDEGELVCEGIEAWLGLRRTSPALVLSLLRLCAISPCSCNNDSDGVKRYHINEGGRQLLDGKPSSDLLSALRQSGVAA